jgi:hypothetical protein
VSELVLELKQARPAAPEALRERVAELAAREPEPRRRLGWSVPRFQARRIALVLVPACLALAVLGALAGGLATSGGDRTDVAASREGGVTRADLLPAGKKLAGSGSAGINRGAPHDKLDYATADRRALGSPAAVPRPARTHSAGSQSVEQIPVAPNRLQDYAASMRIRLDDVDGLSGATQRAMRLARRLGGYVVSVQYGSEGSHKGNAYLTLRVPITRVQTAVVRLSGLGTILAQNVRINDVQPQVDALQRRIIRLTSDIEAIDARLKSSGLSDAERVRLQFQRERLVTSRRQAVLSRRATINRASFATVSLDLTTQKREEPAAPAGRFHRIVGHAGGILAAEAAWTLLILAVALPFVVLLALVFFGARTARRLADRRLLESS